MLTKAKTIQGFKLNAVDGELGKVKEFFFDDRFWTVRYLVVDTGNWLNDRQVLISPYFLKYVNYDSKLIDVTLTKDQIENSPPLESDKPISRQFENSYYGYYGAPMYYTGPHVWGSYPYVTSDRDKWADAHEVTSEDKSWDPNLRSSKDVTKNSIQATDDEVGKVVDFIVDDESWEIRYLIVDTGNWLSGRKVLIPPQWIDKIGIVDEKVYVPFTRSTIEHAPEYDDDINLTRDYESRLYQHYEREGYWTEEPATRDYRNY